MDSIQAKIIKNILTRQYKIESKKMKILSSKIKVMEDIIIQNCENSNTGHNWITEREQCMYGDKFTLCKKCGVDFKINRYKMSTK